MRNFDPEALLQPVSDSAPSGENLEYDPSFAEMEKLAQRVDDQQFGDTTIPGQEPDWDSVGGTACELFERTRDLRVGMYLLQASIRTLGIQGIRDSLRVLLGLVERFWDTVHPQLDPDDDNDPTIRVNTIAAVADQANFIAPVRTMPLAKSRVLGTVTRRDIGMATGEFPPPSGEDARPPEMSSLEAVFTEAGVEALQTNAQAASEAAQLIRQLDAAVTNQVGAGQMRSLSAAAKELDAIHKIYAEQFARLGGGAAPAGGESAGSDASGGAGGAVAAGGAVVAGAPPAFRWDAEITNRDDALRLLDKVSQFFEKHEPSSPVPLLIRRAKRLASMSFLEVLFDLSPDGVSRAEEMVGTTREELMRQRGVDVDSRDD